MDKRTSRFAVILIAALCLPPAIHVGAQPVELPPVVSSVSSSASTNDVSPEGVLNDDGTLRLDGTFSGALNLSGWDVQLDSERGPVFNLPEAPSAATTLGDWAALDGGGTGALNDVVYAMAMMGPDVYVAGNFADVDNIPAADYIAKWNAISGWSALGGSASGASGPLSGGVRALAVSGNSLYAGGSFGYAFTGPTRVQNYAAARVAKWDTVSQTWSALGYGPYPNTSAIWYGVVYALAVDSSGNVYAGGSFEDVKNKGSTLNAADFVAKFDGTNWTALGSGSGGNGSLNSYVKAIGVDSGGIVYAGGTFTDAANSGGAIPEADYIAKWTPGTPGTWASVGSDGVGGGSLNLEVNAIAINSSDEVYVGGSFLNVTNADNSTVSAADFIAKWNGTWSALGNNGASDGSLNSAVSAIALSGTNVYVGGGFTNVNNNGTPSGAADYVAVWDGSNWSSLGGDGAGGGSIGAPVYAIAASGPDVHVGGNFVEVNNLGTLLSHAAYAAHYNATGWSSMGSVQGSLNRTVRTVAISGSTAYVGGDFEDVVNKGIRLKAADYIAKWDGSDWSALGADGQGNGAIPLQVVAIEVDSSGNVYAGGWFNHVHDGATLIPEADYIAKWDGAHWSALGHGATPGEGALNGGVSALAASGSTLYAGGNFVDINNKGNPLPAADYIAKWDGNDWSALGSGSGDDGSLNCDVYDIAVSGSNVYAVGCFEDVINKGTMLGAADWVAKWDGLDWSALGDNGAGNGSLGITANAAAITLMGSNVYVGGYFHDVQDGSTTLTAADHVARWDGTHWYALGDDGAGDGSLNDEIYSMATDGVNLYVGGDFTDVQDGSTTLTAADHVARWDGTHWWALGSGAGGEGAIGGLALTTVNALAVGSTELYAGGFFFNVNNKGTELPYADHIASYGLSGSLTYKSSGTLDGWILESAENSSVGGTKNAGATTFRLGDDAGNEQYRAILSFNTASLDDAAIVTSATLQFKKTGRVGGNPFNSLGNILVDIKTGAFKNNSALQLGDFKAGASKAAILTITNAPVLNWYSANLSPADLALINKAGVTQFRLRFAKGDNNNHLANYLKFASGNAGSASRPLLIITYLAP